MNSKKDKQSTWRSGDTGNILMLFNTLIYLGAIAAQELGMLNIYSKVWQKEGFCISFKDMDVLYQSHALSFYGDTIFAVILWLILIISRGKGMSEKALEPIAK